MENLKTSLFTVPHFKMHLAQNYSTYQSLQVSSLQTVSMPIDSINNNLHACKNQRHDIKMFAQQNYSFKNKENKYINSIQLAKKVQAPKMLNNTSQLQKYVIPLNPFINRPRQYFSSMTQRMSTISQVEQQNVQEQKPQDYDEVHQKNSKEKQIFKEQIARTVDHEWMLANNIHLLNLQASIFDMIQEEFKINFKANKDLDALKSNFEGIMNEARKKSNIWTQEIVDSQCQKQNDFFKQISLQMLEDKQPYFMYEPDSFNDEFKNQFLQEVLFKMQNYQNFEHQIQFKQAKKYSLDFVKQYIQNNIKTSKMTQSEDNQSDSKYIYAYQLIKGFQKQDLKEKLTNLFQTTPNIDPLSRAMETWLRLPKLDFIYIKDQQKISDVVFYYSVSLFLEQMIQNGFLQGLFNQFKQNKDINLFRISYDDNQIFEGAGDVNGKSYGRMIFKNGDYYQGEFENGQMHGWGELRDASNQFLQIGNWNKGKFQFCE